MLQKKLATLGISTVAGIVLAYVTVLLIQLTQTNVTPDYYGWEYFGLTALFLGAAVLVWVDHFLKSEILSK